ncbi:MAG: hypothetical protein FWB96_08350 [Defluviitaleaceae bacterium]|nr:hypothetical protein [Defluviitaleaceae bacterium]MCL2263424.1 hypothetical protein [Defluviitaleaceae bacterium]
MINKALFTEQVKRFWPIPVLATFAYLLIVYLPMAGNMNDNPWLASRQLVDIVSMGNFFMMFTMVLTPVITAFFMFNCFFNKRAATAFYSYPINKKQLLITNAAAGVLLSVIPVLVFGLVLFIPITFASEIDPFRLYAEGEIGMTIRHSVGFVSHGNIPIGVFPGGEVGGMFDMPWVHEVINTFPVVLSLIMRMVIVTVFYFGLAWLAFSLAGHGIIGLLIVGVLPFVPMVLVASVDGLLMMYVFGHANESGNFMNMFFAYHNPAAWGTLIRPNVLEHTQAVVIPAIVYVVLGAVIFTGAYFVSRIRKTERTGNSVVFAPVRHVLVFGVALTTMIITGVVFGTTMGGLLMVHVGFVVGFALGYIVAQMIAEKSFYIAGQLKYLLHFSGVAVALYIFILVFTQFGLNFHVNRVPAEDEIYSVFVSDASWFNLSADEWRVMSNNDPEFIAAARQAHRTILDGRSELHDIPNLRGNARYVREVDGVIVSREPFYIRYILQNGRSVARQYSLTGSFIEDTGLNEFLDSEPVILSQYPAFRMPEVIQAINLEFSHFVFNEQQDRYRWEFDDRDRIFIDDPAQIQAALEIIAQGAVDAARFTRANNRQIHNWHHRGSHWWDTVHEDEQQHGIRVNIWFNIDWDIVDQNRRIPFWRNPHIWGESAAQLFELVHGWGLE